MWILTLLPDSYLEIIVNVVLLMGIVLTILTFFVINKLLMMIPGMAKYYRGAQMISLVILCAGIYFKGGYSVEKDWRARVAELEIKVVAAEAKSKEQNVVVEQKIVYRDRVIREKGQEIIKYIDRYKDKEIIKEIPGPERVRVEEVIKYIENCPIPQEIIDAHNMAAELNKATEAKR
jgi:hypothetical protein